MSFEYDLSQYLVSRGWRVTVYCQGGPGDEPRECYWRGVRLMQVPVPFRGSLGSILFDLRSTSHAAREDGIALVLGYNTALFSAVFRMKGHRSLMNMDGIEWKRGKHGLVARLWFIINEFLGCHLSDTLIADHPAIAEHLVRWRPSVPIQVIPYGSRRTEPATSHDHPPLGLTSGEYVLVIARPEPENSILEVVQAYAGCDTRCRLVVLGNYDRRNRYQRAVLDAGTGGTLFPGAIYDRDTVDSLRRHARVYVHGHRVGGTNPSLVEALGAGSAILAHDNKFNRWVAEDAALYFRNSDDCGELLRQLVDPGAEVMLARLRGNARRRHDEAFSLEARLHDYEELLTRS